jgi:hypothetical protein
MVPGAPAARNAALTRRRRAPVSACYPVATPAVAMDGCASLALVRLDELEPELAAGREGRDGLLEPALKHQIKRVTPKTLAAFKHLVEQGEPPRVKHSKLPPAPVAC